MVTSCDWQQYKLISPEGESRVVYVFLQQGRQCLSEAGKQMMTVFSTNASRLEFISIKEALQAQNESLDNQDGMTVQFLRCESEFLAAIAALPPPLDESNLVQMAVAAVPYAVYYFANWEIDNKDPILAVPISLFSGQYAPNLVKLLREFPLETDGVDTLVEANLSLTDAFGKAAVALESVLAKHELGDTSLIWCDVAIQHERHRRLYNQDNNSFEVERLCREEGRRHVIGVRPIEFLSVALIMVPTSLIQLKAPVNGCRYGIIDGVAGNAYLSKRKIIPDNIS